MTGFIPTEADFETISDLKDKEEWPLPWTSTVGLIPYIKRLKGNLVGLEIGTARGESAAHILENCPNVKSLYTIDPYKEYMDWNGLIEQFVLDKFKEIAQTNLKEYIDINRLYMKEATTDTLHEHISYIPEFFDFVFVDGDHSKEWIIKDLTAIYPMVKKNGIVAVHDTNLNGVMDAIKEFKEANKIRIPLNRVLNGVAFWYK